MSPHITLFVITIFFQLTAFSNTDLRNHSFPTTYCNLGFILTAGGSQQFFNVRYISQCTVGNFNEPTRNTPCRQIKILQKSKSSSKCPLFYRPGAQSLSCNSQRYITCSSELTCFWTGSCKPSLHRLALPCIQWLSPQYERQSKLSYPTETTR